MTILFKWHVRTWNSFVRVLSKKQNKYTQERTPTHAHNNIGSICTLYYTYDINCSNFILTRHRSWWHMKYPVQNKSANANGILPRVVQRSIIIRFKTRMLFLFRRSIGIRKMAIITNILTEAATTMTTKRYPNSMTNRNILWWYSLGESTSEELK